MGGKNLNSIALGLIEMIRYGGNKILNLREVIWSIFRIVIVYLKTLLEVSTKENKIDWMKIEEQI